MNQNFCNVIAIKFLKLILIALYVKFQNWKKLNYINHIRGETVWKPIKWKVKENSEEYLP